MGSLNLSFAPFLCRFAVVSEVGGLVFQRFRGPFPTVENHQRGRFPDHRRPAFEDNALEALLAHPENQWIEARLPHY